MNKLFIILILSYSISSFCQKENISKENDKKEIKILQDSLSKKLFEIQNKGFINGFSVAIVNEKGTLYQKGFGFSNIENKENYNENTIQQVGSVSKTLIGIALLKAQELGKLNLDEPINKYLPFKVENPFNPEVQITIRHLATHTSTIVDTDIYLNKAYVLKENIDIKKDKFEYPQVFNLPSSRIEMEEFLKKILNANGEWYDKNGFLKVKPGEKFEYTNIGATLAALIIEKATKISYDKFTTKYILKPLVMKSSGWSFKQIDFKKHTRLYENPTLIYPFYSLITYPDGGFLTTSKDMGKYLSELIKGYCGKGKLLSKSSYEQLFTEQLKAENFDKRNEKNPYNDEYNTGIFMGFSAKDYIGHTGGDPGVTCYMFFNKKTKTGRFLVTNTSLNNRETELQFYEIWDKLDKYLNQINKKPNG